MIRFPIFTEFSGVSRLTITRNHGFLHDIPGRCSCQKDTPAAALTGERLKVLYYSRSKKLTIWVLIALRRVRTTGWECHIYKHDTGHPTPENPFQEFSLPSAVTLSSRTITLIRLDSYIGVPRFRRYVIGLACPFPISEVLARLLSRSRVFPFSLRLVSKTSFPERARYVQRDSRYSRTAFSRRG